MGFGPSSLTDVLPELWSFTVEDSGIEWPVLGWAMLLPHSGEHVPEFVPTCGIVVGFETPEALVLGSCRHGQRSGAGSGSGPFLLCSPPW